MWFMFNRGDVLPHKSIHTMGVDCNGQPTEFVEFAEIGRLPGITYKFENLDEPGSPVITLDVPEYTGTAYVAKVRAWLKGRKVPYTVL